MLADVRRVVGAGDDEHVAGALVVRSEACEVDVVEHAQRPAREHRFDHLAIDLGVERDERM